MNKKSKKEKQKIISKAQKTTNEKNYTSKFVNDSTVIVEISKDEIDSNLASILTIGIMLALKEVKIKDIDITIKENKSSFSIIVEK